MTADDLRALSAAATPGPWKSYKYGITARNAAGAPYEPCGDYQDDMRHEDKELIVWLRNHADALADLIDAARWISTVGHGEKLTDMSTCRCGDPLPCPVLRTRYAIEALEATP